MPKKKIQHKGKPKHATEESEDVIKPPRENAEEEYTTVVDFENNRKYSKRLIESNWSKYETSVSDFDSVDESNEEPKTNDFNYLLKTASSDCSYFQFNSEKLWVNANNSVPASKIFNLDLNVLSSGLACVPFYERMGIDEKELSAEDKERFDKEAENNWNQYNLIIDKLGKKLEDDANNKNSKNNEQTLGKSLKVNVDLSSDESEKQKSIGLMEGSAEISLREVKDSDTVNNKIGKKKQSIFFSENDEDLEDWLDSVLDE